MRDIRKGVIITFDGEPYVVSEADFLRKQQRRPVMRTMLKHLKTGRTREHSFQQSDKIEEASVAEKTVQFLYSAPPLFVFMDTATYDQMELPQTVVGEAAPYLIEGQLAQVVMFDGEPITVSLPIKIERKVIESPPGVRGDTSTNVMKEATLEGGLKTRVPLFVNEGDSVRIDTRTGTYVERV